MLKQNDPELLLEAIFDISAQLENVDQYVVSNDVKQQLLDLLSHQDGNVRESVTYVFELIAETGDVVAEPLMAKMLDALKDKGMGSDSIARAIGWLGGPVHIPSLVEVMDSSEPKLLQSLIAALGDIKHEQALPELFKTLKHKDEDVRLSAVKAIGQIDHRDAVQPLIEALSDNSNSVRTDAAVILGNLNDASAVEPLIALLKTDPQERTIKALEKLGDARVVPYLIQGLANNKLFDDTAVQAMHSLKKFKAEKQAFDALMIVAKNKNQERLARITALGLIGKTENHQATKILLKLLLNKKESNLIRMYAATALGDLNDKKAIPTLATFAFGNFRSKVPLMERIARLGSSEISDLLKKIRQDQDSGVVKEAVLALGKIGGSEFLEPLLLLLQDKNSNSQVRMKTIEALGFMGRKEAVEPLVALLKEDDKYIRQAVVIALAKINDDLAIPALSLVLQKDKFKYARSYASEALGKTNNRDVIPALMKSLNDSNSSVRRASREALVKMSDASLVQQYVDGLLNEEQETQYRTEMAEILASFNQPEVVDALLASLKNKNWKIRVAALSALGTLKSDKSVDLILEILSGDENKYALFSAITALSKIGNPKAISALMDASNNPDHAGRAVSALCTFKDDPRVTKVMSDISMHGPSARIRKKTRCES